MSLADDQVYDVRKVGFVFAAASLALLGSCGWWVWVDYHRPWRHWQREHHAWKAFFAHADRVSLEQGDSLRSEAETEQIIARDRAWQSWVHRTLINLPLLDFLAPPGTPGRQAVREVRVPDVPIDLHFARVDRRDRCMSCHAAVDDPRFMPARLDDCLRDFTAKAPAHLRRDSVLMAHPQLDLFVGADSPHPVERFGCTVCHQGNGLELDVALAGHREAETVQNASFAMHGLLINRADTPANGWPRPMLEQRYVQARCAFCHTQIADLMTPDGRNAGARLDEGRYLAERLGCVNCHLAPGLENARQVGPDLSRIATKLDPGFVQRWVLDPKAFRPATYMPSSLIDQRVDVEPRRRMEAVAIAAYLFAVSEAAAPQDPGALEAPTSAHVSRGRALFEQRGCLACHVALGHRPVGPGNPFEDTLGTLWIGSELAAERERALREANEGTPLTDDELSAIDEAAFTRAAEMAYPQQVGYAMTHLADERATLFGAGIARPPTFTRFAPELSRLADKLPNDGRAGAWLRGWLRDPGEYDPASRMPDPRLADDEADAIAVYLLTLKGGGAFDVSRLDQDAIRDELTRIRDGMMAEWAPDARDATTTRWVAMGADRIAHYACARCHLIPGFEEAPRPGPSFTHWADKPFEQLDFGLALARTPQPGQETATETALEPTRASFAWHKIRTPRIYDRGLDKPLHERLRMPGFGFDVATTEALVTWLLSQSASTARGDARIAYEQTPAGDVAAGRLLARQLNCMACHPLDGNAAVFDQYVTVALGPELVFAAEQAPPRLRAEGAKVDAAWLYDYLRQVTDLRPWLGTRMPDFRLDAASARALTAYLVRLGQREADWLGDRLDRLSENRSGKESTYRDDADRQDLIRYARLHQLLPEGQWPTATSTRMVPSSTRRVSADAREEIRGDTQFLRSLLDVPFPLGAEPVKPYPPERVADGRALFLALECLACHAFGDASAPGANRSPTAPNLALVADRLRPDWTRAWLEAPLRIEPGTQMPSLFGRGEQSAFAEFDDARRSAIGDRLSHPSVLDDPGAQIEAITAFMYAASAQGQTVTQPGGVPAVEPDE